MKVALIGYGKMGHIIEGLLQERGHEVVAKFGKDGIIDAELKLAEVAIEFSVPEAAYANILKCFELGVPVVTGTTGWLAHYEEAVARCKALEGAMLYASNFSLGVNLFFALNRQLAALMRDYPQYRAEMTEIHHIHKKDAPSGTAITLAEDLIAATGLKAWKLSDENPSAEELPIAAIRENEVPGTHAIQYRSAIDDIEIKHTAHNREGFALGAVLAAEYLKGKTGVYSMRDVLNLKS